MKEDLATFFLKQGTISESQERYLAGCKFYREDLFSDDETSSFTDAVSSESTGQMPVESTGIMICSVPNDAMEEDECYQTPPEQHTNDPAEQVEETPVSVDLAKDTDLVFSDGKNNISTLIVSDSQENHDLGVKSVKNRIFKGKSPLLEGLATPELKKLDLDMNDGLNDGLDSQIGNDSEDVEVVKDSCEDASGHQTMELDKPESTNSIPPEPALVQGSVSESRKLPDWVDKSVVEQQGTSCASPNVGDKCAERGRGKGGSGGREGRLGGRGGLAEAETSGINGNSSPSGGVGEAANVEVPDKPFVTLDDLMGPLEDDDILVAAIKAGWKFPRPRSWGPEGSQSKVVHKS